MIPTENMFIHINAFLISLTVLIIFSCKTPSVIAIEELEQGNICSNQNNYEQALIHYEVYLSICPKLGMYRNFKQEAEIYRKTAHVYATLGKYSVSTKYLQRAYKLDSADNNNLQLIEDLRQLALVNIYQGKYKDAETILQQVIDLNEGMESSLKSEKINSIASTHLSLSFLHSSFGNFQMAISSAEEAIELFKKTGKQRKLAEAALHLAMIYSEQGKLDLAEKQIELSKSFSEKDSIPSYRYKRISGNIEQKKGHYQRALQLQLDAFSESMKTNIIPQSAWQAIKVGDLYMLLGDYPNANAFYFRAKQLNKLIDTSNLSGAVHYADDDTWLAKQQFTRMGSKVNIAMADLKIGDNFLVNNIIDSALSYYFNASSVFKSINNKQGEALALFHIAKARYKQGKYQNALVLLDTATVGVRNIKYKWQLEFQKGRNFEKLQKVDSAISYFQKSINIIESIRGDISAGQLQTSFFNNKISVYENLILAYCSKGDFESALLVAEKARSRRLLDVLSQRTFETGNSNDKLLINKAQELQKQIEVLLQRIKNNAINQNKHSRSIVMGFSEELKSVQEKHSSVLQQLQASGSKFYNLVFEEIARFNEIQENIASDRAIVEYWITEEKLLVWVITNRSMSFRMLPVRKEQLLEDISNCRLAVSRLSNNAKQKMHKLYTNILAPIENELEAYKRICFIPHHSLHFIPFHALVDNSGKFFVENHIVSYAPSLLSWHKQMQKQSSNENFAGFALGNVAVSGFKGLAGTKTELDIIKTFYDSVDVRYETDLNKPAFFSTAPKHGVIHLATHGWMNEMQPMYSFIVMAPTDDDDGLLRVYELFGLKLNAELVTLSACQTGLGKLSNGDDMVGLSRAFMYAGASSVIASLWSVDDEATACLMAKFYQYWSAGYDKDEALSYAQRFFIEKENLGDVQKYELRKIRGKLDIEEISSTKKAPFFWAPFMLMGKSE